MFDNPNHDRTLADSCALGRDPNSLDPAFIYSDTNPVPNCIREFFFIFCVEIS